MLLTVTLNPAVDQTLQFDEPLAPDRVMRATGARFDAGGKGINVARNLTAMDHNCLATGVVGGFTGGFIRDRLAADGVAHAFADIDDATRLNTTALAATEEYKLNQAGPEVDPAVVDDLLDIIREHDPDHVVVGGSLPPGLTTDAVDTIATAGDWDTVVDMDGDALRRLDAGYALCKPNREELGAATDTTLDTVEACARAAVAFRGRGFDRVLASLGAEGALLATGQTVLHADPPAADVVDTVGAGDALLSGFLAAWTDGADDATSLRTGVAVATRVVERAGPTIPDDGDVVDDAGGVTVRELDHVASDH